MANSKGKRRILRWAERTLLLAGIVGIAVWVSSNAIPAIWQSWETWTFDREAQGKPVSVTAYLIGIEQKVTRDIAAWFGFHPVPLPSDSPNRPGVRPRELKNNALIGRLSIPRLHLTTTVREGTGAGTLLLAAGHIPGTNLPGSGGNVGVAAHRDTLFSALAQIRNNDLIHFETLDGSYTYEVESMKVVRPGDVSVLKAGRHPELTLVTCYPFDYIGAAPERFIVKARQVSPASPQQPLLEVAQPVVAKPDVSKPVEDLPRAISPGTRKIRFYVGTQHSRQLTQGISIGVTRTAVDSREMDGWMWIMPERRTIWLRHQLPGEPVIFLQDGRTGELMITSLTESGVSGYLLLVGERSARSNCEISKGLAR